MKITELFEYIDEVKPNAFSDDVKLRWLSEVEGMIQSEILLLSPPDILVYTSKEATKTVTAGVRDDGTAVVRVADTSGGRVLNLSESELYPGERSVHLMTDPETSEKKRVVIERDAAISSVTLRVNDRAPVTIERGASAAESGTVDIVLLVGAPYHRIYYAYLEAMMDYQEGEYGMYANSVGRFNSYWNEYAAWIGEHVKPGLGHSCDNLHYLSAYAIAVRHGYEGTEEEWAAFQIESARNAARAQEGAVQAAEKANEAMAYAERAKESAASASEHMTSSSASAAASAESASAASVSAENAAASASQAGQSASAAIQSAENAHADSEAARLYSEQADASAKAASASQDAAQQARDAAISAASHYPYIGDDGYWYVWDPDSVPGGGFVRGERATDNGLLQETADALLAHTKNGTAHVTTDDKITWNAKYTRPHDGIPQSDLAPDVRTALGKADSAIQEHNTVLVDALPEATADAVGRLYVVQSPSSTGSRAYVCIYTGPASGYIWFEVGAYVTAGPGTDGLMSAEDYELLRELEDTAGVGQASSAGVLITEITLPAGGWTAAEPGDGEYPYCIGVPVAKARADQFPIVSVHTASRGTALQAGLSDAAEASDGALRFWAAQLPGEDIRATAVLLLSGEGAGGASGAYVLPIASRDTLGAVKVGENMNVEPDGTLSVDGTCVTDETVSSDEEVLGMLDNVFDGAQG